MPKYILAVLIVSGLLISFGSQGLSDKLTLRVLNVGQGDSIYLRLPTQEDILIDAGPDDRVLSSLGKYMPVGDRTIELAIISHNHADHIGGIKAILENYAVNELWINGAIHTTDQYLTLLKLIKEKNIPVKVVSTNTLSTRGEVKLLVIYPIEGLVGLQPEDQHDATIVTKVSYRDFCALLTGDLDMRHEAIIVDTTEISHESIECKMLKVTHHGSAHGFSEAFLEKVKPKTSVISVGAKNRYGHPAEELLTRLTDVGSEIYRTDLNGTVTVTTDGTHYSTKTEK